MRPRFPTLPAAAGFAALAAFTTPAAAQADPDPTNDAWHPHRGTAVLYAGKADGHREKVFGAFLKKWFDKSATIPMGKLSMESAKDYDVVIVDWMSQYGNDGYPKRERSLFGAPIKLDASFTKPMIAMTYVGSQVRRGYKLDWL